MNDVREMTRAALMAKVEAEALTNRAKTLLAQLFAAMQEMGAERLRARDPEDGADLGTLVVTAGSTSAIVTDEDKFFDWVAQTRPDEIVTVAAVRSSFRRALLDAIKDKGEPVDGDGNPIPGVTITTSDPHLTTTPTRVARARAVERVGSTPPA